MTKENAIDLRRIFDGAAKHLHALQALKRLTMHWDDLLVLILISKLDSLTLRERETFLTGNELPSLKQLLDFITHRCQVLEAITRVPQRKSKQNRSQILSGHRARLPLNLNTTSVKEITSFIIAKTLWHFQYHKGPRKFAVANFASIACAPLLMHVSKCTSGQCKVCQAKHNTLFHMPSTQTHRLTIPIRSCT